MSRVLCLITLILLAACTEPRGFEAPTDTFESFRARIGTDAVEQVVARVDTAFFGPTRPLLGRMFVADDYTAEAPVAILSHGLWSERFSSRRDIIGSPLEVNGTPHTIVGIMPPGVDVPAGVSLWVPRQ
jgi:hypothetical protein